MRSFDFKMVLNNVSQLKHIQVVGHFELKKMTPNWNALAKLIISYL